jgi:hypothetical protein
MAKRNDFAPVFTLAIVAVCLLGFNVNAQKYNLKVPTSNCELKATDSCFNVSVGSRTFDVGKEVTQLSDLYTFCTDIKVITVGNPARIILTLDNSRSMCQEVTQCAGATNNDPTNKRVDGANAFLDNVAGKCPTCEVGVIVYTGVGSDSTGRGTISNSILPLELNAANVTRLHTVINSAKCGSGLFKTEETNKLSKRALTFTGMALDSAIKMVDLGYDSLASGGMQRHIILLTDGDWQKPSTSDLIAAYAQAFAGRKLPVIHGVFISDTATHVAAGFPPQGLTACDTSQGIKVPMDLQFLQLAATASGGKYFPGSTPQTIVATFDTLFKVIVDTSRIGLVSVSFTNTNTGEIKPGTFTSPSPGRYTVNVPSFNLDFGKNTFIVTWVTQDTNQVRLTKNDTFTVNRQTTVGTGATQVFTTECKADTVNMLISCKPSALLTTVFDTVTAKVNPKDVGKFVPNNIVVRGFTPFPDETDNRVIALFHLDEKITNSNVYNSAQGGKAGTGSPTMTTSGAFGSAMSAGTFTMSMGLPVTGDFTVECWIRPITCQTADIIKGSDFSLGIADGYLTAKIGGVTITTTNGIDTNVWQHVAVARSNGSTNLYINGIPMAAATNSTSSISGNLTVGNFTGGIVDEIRVSTFIRATALQGKILLIIPTAENLSWKINATNPVSPTAILPPEMWRGDPQGELKFQFTDLLPGPVIINFFDTLAKPPIMWSKNGDPVLFGTTGVQVSATLKDTSHEGHLDMIDIKWTEDIKLKKPYPGATEFIGTLIITTLDGKSDTLHATTLVFDETNKVIHIILNENNKQLETAWKDAIGIKLTDIPMTDEGKPFVVVKVIDGAEPIPIDACYAPADDQDTLKLKFSEPVASDSFSMDRFYRVNSKGKDPFQRFNPVKIIKTNDTLVIVFSYNQAGGEHAISAYDWNVQEFFVSGPPSPALAVDYCATISLVKTFQIGPNPVNFSAPQPTRYVQFPDQPSATKQITGQICELVLKRPVQGANGNHVVQAWITIFDAVGNVLVDKAPMGVDSKNRVKLLWAWDGKNKNKVQVAGGTYLTRYDVKSFNENGVLDREERGNGKTGVRTVK